MSIKKFSFKKLMLAIVWLSMAAGTLVVLVAATQNQNGKTCKDIIIEVKGINANGYVSKKQIMQTISGGRPDLMKGQLIKTFDLSQLEALLETNLWIRNAELFFDNNDVLHVDITEREPVARVFKLSGQSFYIDDLGEQLPLTNDQIARVPVFTNFPDETTDARIKDSLLQQQVKEMGQYILKNDFWMAQVDQVNINNYEFELIPKLGSHLITFGSGDQVEQKFKRLLLFYKKVMLKTGWNYYSNLDVRFNKQLVAVRRDSISLFKSFEINTNDFQVATETDSSSMQKDSLRLTEKPYINDSLSVNPSSVAKENKQSPIVSGTKPVLSLPVRPLQNQNHNALKNQLPTPKKTVITKEEKNVLNEAKAASVKKPAVKKVPKAVMQRKE